MRNSSHAGIFAREVEVVKHLCEVINSPRSLAVWLCLEYECFEALFALGEPLKYDRDPQRYAEDYLVSDILTKCPRVPLPGIDKRAAAVVKFHEAEVLCQSTNNRLLCRDSDPSWLETFKRQFRTVMGPLRGEGGALCSIESRMRFGPGALVGLAYSEPASAKYDDPLTVTQPLSDPRVRQAIQGDIWFEHQPSSKVVLGNEWVSVPKNAKTDRGIAKEPALNSFVQLGIGDYLADRLKRFGVMLDRQEWNQFLAEMAYDWDLATIDLSMASDCLCRQLINQFAHADWAELLNSVRSPYTSIDGKDVCLEKHSSMGNGYTFPLETAVFLAVLRTFLPKEDWPLSAVYGDDLIVPNKYAADVITALEYLGFRVNKEKTHLATGFSESCGRDYYLGKPVRPFYLRLDDSAGGSATPYSVRIANSLRLWMKQVYGFNPKRFKPLWDSLRGMTRGQWRRTSVPDTFGDLGFLMDPSDFESGAPAWEVPHDRKGHGWEGFCARPVVFYDAPTHDIQSMGVVLTQYNLMGRSDTRDERSGFFTAPNGADPLPSYGREPIRGLYGKPLTRRAFTPCWHGGYEWR